MNDHLAFGARVPMAKYLTRLRHIERLGIDARLRGKGSEGFLGAALSWDVSRLSYAYPATARSHGM